MKVSCCLFFQFSTHCSDCLCCRLDGVTLMFPSCQFPLNVLVCFLSRWGERITHRHTQTRSPTRTRHCFHSKHKQGLLKAWPYAVGGRTRSIMTAADYSCLHVVQHDMIAGGGFLSGEYQHARPDVSTKTIRAISIIPVIIFWPGTPSDRVTFCLRLPPAKSLHSHTAVTSHVAVSSWSSETPKLRRV